MERARLSFKEWAAVGSTLENFLVVVLPVAENTFATTGDGPSNTLLKLLRMRPKTHTIRVLFSCLDPYLGLFQQGTLAGATCPGGLGSCPAGQLGGPGYRPGARGKLKY
jgi:hypothetical protein